MAEPGAPFAGLVDELGMHVAGVPSDGELRRSKAARRILDSIDLEARLLSIHHEYANGHARGLHRAVTRHGMSN